MEPPAHRHHSSEGVGGGDDPETGKIGPAEELLSRFGTALEEADISKLEAVFLPPDDTPAGKARRKLLDNARKDFARSGKELRKMSSRFTDIKQKVEGKDKLVITATMIDEVVSANGSTVRSKETIEFRITPTDSGWKIVEFRLFRF